MNTLELFVATCTNPTTETAGIALWPYLDVTGTMIQIPRPECEVAGMDTSAIPEAVVLVRRIQDGLGLTIGQVGKALGCSRQAVHGWMRGKRIDSDNHLNLRELAAWASEWAACHPEGGQASDLLDPTFLEKLGRAGATSAKGRAMWEKRMLSPAGASDWNSLPSSEDLMRKIGAHPISATEQAHRRAHNLGSLNSDARL